MPKLITVVKTVLFVTLLAAPLALAGGCTGVPETECTRNCDAQEAAMCTAVAVTEACHLQCQDRYENLLTPECVQALEALYLCRNTVGYTCSVQGLPQLKVLQSCGAEYNAASPCLPGVIP